jgi:hypothetical protein
MHRGIISLVLSACALAAAPAASALAQSAPRPPGPESKPSPPIVFYVARGEPDSCGPGCREWIAAEGKIDGGAEPRLWELLRKLGNDRKLPIYFHSGGGSVIGGLEIGRLIRARGLTAGVGWTVPTECDRPDPDELSCAELKRSGRELAAGLITGNGVCASSCVNTILGGVVRDVGAGARVGIHDMSMPATIRSFDESGHIVDRPLPISAEATRRDMDGTQRLIAAYLKEMGITRDLLTAALAIPAKDLHILTREELIAFGIDRRDAVESAWSLLDKPAGASAVKFIETRDGPGGAYRTAMLSLTCRDKTVARLQYVHQVGAESDGAAGLRVAAGGRSFPLTRLAGAAQGDSRPRVERHAADLPLAALDAAAFVIEPNATSGQGADSPAASVGSLRVQAAAPVLAALARRCGAGGR